MIFAQKGFSYNLTMGPFKDSTDGITAETGLAGSITQSEIQLVKHNSTSLGTTSDSSPLVLHLGDGYYSIPLTSVDLNTTGVLRVFIALSGVLDVWMDIMVLSGEVFDSLVHGTDKLQVDVQEMADGIGGITLNHGTFS